jgi:hypothetical protein
MAKRLLFTLVGAAIGTLLGIAIAGMAGLGHWAVLACAAAGAASPLLLGPPGPVKRRS